jgi:hypothetical protein
MIIWQQPKFNEQENCIQTYSTNKLQIWWAESSKSMAYISSGQFTDNQLVCDAFDDNKIKSGTGRLCLKTLSGLFFIEAKRVAFGNNYYVMSLIQNEQHK